MEIYLFIFVVICFAASWSYRGYAVGGFDAHILRSAMLLTVMADFFILILFDNTAGVFVFVFAQALYSVRYWRSPNFLVALPFLLLGGLYVYSAVYAFLLVTNVVGAYRQRGLSLAFGGMALFLCCDIAVVLYNLGFGGWLFYVIWGFYAPSQVMLAMSAKEFGFKKLSFRA
jgi:hypothetical protein